ncbi:MAG: pseudouridine synthase [Anaerolineae bacterium]|nr:pseudouridine synthase [Anaerolineae bacterium]
MEERIQKLMAQAGIASRRDAEALIAQGRVTVNGHVANLGDKADPAVDDIRYDGERLRFDEARVYIMINKPMGIVTAVRAQEQEMRRTVRELVPVEGYLYPVGRLDADSEGLVVLTNDGELAQKLTHPRYDHPKVYDVILTGSVPEDVLDVWRRGVVLEDGPTKPVDIEVISRDRDTTRVHITMREGRKRQIRRIANRFGYPVQKLVRIEFDVLKLGNLGKGEWRYLTEGEINMLQLSAASSRHRGKSGPRPPEQQSTRRPPAARTRSAGGESRAPRAPSRRPARRSNDEQSDYSAEDRPRYRSGRAGAPSRNPFRPPDEDRPRRASTGRPARRFDDNADERTERPPEDRPRSRSGRAGAPRRSPAGRPTRRFGSDRPDTTSEDRPRRASTGRPAHRFDDNSDERTERPPEDRPRSRSGRAGAPSRNPFRPPDEDRPRRASTGRPARRFDDTPDERPEHPPEDRPRSRSGRAGAPRRNPTGRPGNRYRSDRPETTSEDRPRRSPTGRPARRSESDRSDRPERASDDRPRSRSGAPRRRPTGGGGGFQRSRTRRPTSPRSKPRNRNNDER